MKRVIISDTHLGQTGQDGFGQVSLLSAVPEGHEMKSVADKKLNSFAELVDKFSAGERVVLCVAGDMLDLSLSTMKDCLKSLVHMLGPLKNVEGLEYVVGNHDHHVWMLWSEQRQVLNNLEIGRLPKVNPYIATSSFGEHVSWLSLFLSQQLLRRMECRIAYPLLLEQKPNICVTHGHLFNKLYTFISRVLSPFMEKKVTDSNSLAVTNIAITEFIYWLMGESGEGLGVDGVMEAIYTDIDKGKDSQLRKALVSVANVLFPEGLLKFVPDSWERWFLRKIAAVGAKKLSAGKGQPLTSSDRYASIESSRAALKEWMDSYLALRDPMIFVSGHTHVADKHEFDNIKYFNMGSWLYEPSHPDPDTYALFINNDDLDFRKI